MGQAGLPPEAVCHGAVWDCPLCCSLCVPVGHLVAGDIVVGWIMGWCSSNGDWVFSLDKGPRRLDGLHRISLPWASLVGSGLSDRRPQVWEGVVIMLGLVLLEEVSQSLGAKTLLVLFPGGSSFPPTCSACGPGGGRRSSVMCSSLASRLSRSAECGSSPPHRHRSHPHLRQPLASCGSAEARAWLQSWGACPAHFGLTMW